MGWRAITGHRLRSSLTTLGVVIGIGSVIVFLIMGGGFLADAVADVEGETEPELSVQTQTDPEVGFGWQLDTTPIYTQSDVERLRSIDGVEYVAPDGWLSAAQLEAGGDRLTGGFNARATIPEHLRQGTESLDGRAFDAEDETVLNEQAATALSADIGEEVTLTFDDGREETLTVTGIVDDGDSGWNAQPAVYLPVEPHYTATVETPDGTTERAYPLLTIRAENSDALAEVKEQSQSYLSEESDAASLKLDGYDIRVLSPEDQIERFEDLVDQITVFVAAVAGISLLVGSVGIANIMIVSVTERTREIGVMKAVGASKRDVMQLFLVESLVLGILGAGLGVLAGVGFGYLAVTLAGWPLQIPVRGIAFAVAVGIGVGVVSGLYPAWRGARVDPIEALRGE
jgi:putative ABC transport system permease protein